MKKNGFTLAETLITLGIIGVIVAVILPFAQRAMPDEHKIAYLKAYDALAVAVKDLASDGGLYPISDNNAHDYSTFPLLNITGYSNGVVDNNSPNGNRKLCALVGEKLNARDIDNNTCTNDTEILANYNNIFSNHTFTTPNGMRWRLQAQQNIAVNAAAGTFNYAAYVDTNVNGDDCIYNAQNCTSPTWYKFLISADGTVYPADKMGLSYASTRRGWKRSSREALPNDGDDVITQLQVVTPVLPDNGERDCQRNNGHWVNGECLCTAAESLRGYHWYDAACHYCDPSTGTWDANSGTCTPKEEVPDDGDDEPLVVKPNLPLIEPEKPDGKSDLLPKKCNDDEFWNGVKCVKDEIVWLWYGHVHGFTGRAELDMVREKSYDYTIPESYGIWSNRNSTTIQSPKDCYQMSPSACVCTHFNPSATQPRVDVGCSFSGNYKEVRRSTVDSTVLMMEPEKREASENTLAQ